MDITRIPLFSSLKKRMGWLTERQAVLAQNIANVNTPGYKARDLKPVDFGAMAERASGLRMTGASTGGGSSMAAGGELQMAATKTGHMAPAVADGGYRAADDRKPLEVTIDENKINIEDQAVKLAGNASEFTLASTLYKKHMDMIRTALGRGGGAG